MRLSHLLSLVLLIGVAHAQPAEPAPAKQVTRAPTLEGCTPKPHAPDAKQGELRVVDLQVKGRFHPGEMITVSATVAEVTGDAHMGYPGVTLLVEPSPAATLQPHTLYGVNGCGLIAHSWTFQVPKDAAIGTEYRLSAIAASKVRCRDPKTCKGDRRIVTAKVTAPR